MKGPIRLETTEGVAVLTLSNPDRRNALDGPVMRAVRDAVAACVQDEKVRVLVLTGAGKAFCAGMDIAELRALQQKSAEDQLAAAGLFRDLLLDIYRCPKPVVAAVNGAAYGGGAGLAMACDIAIASRDAAFACTEARVGFVPALIGPFVVRAVGERVARDLLLTGRRVSADEALHLHLVSEVADDLLASAFDWAKRCIAGAPASHALTKHLLGAGIEADSTAAVIANAYARNTQTMREGLQAFLEKRPAAWTVPKD